MINNEYDNQIPLDKVIALDPGICKFLVGYTGEGNAVVYGQKDINVLVNLAIQQDHIRSDYSARKQSLPRKFFTLSDRIQNLRNDLHYKIANDLCDNYKYIFLGDFVGGKTKNRFVNRTSLLFAFDMFQKKLIHVSKKKNVIVKIQNEACTSKTCSSCGNYYKQLVCNQQREYKCNACNSLFDRDFNAAKNILVRGLVENNFKAR